MTEQAHNELFSTKTQSACVSLRTNDTAVFSNH